MFGQLITSNQEVNYTMVWRKQAEKWTTKALKAPLSTFEKNITCKYCRIKCEIGIEEKIPLKQGLKHPDMMIFQRIKIIEEKIPLKQGLKQESPPAYVITAQLKRRFH